MHEALRSGVFKRAKDPRRDGVARQTLRRFRATRKERTGGRAVDVPLKGLVDGVGQKRQRDGRRPTFAVELRLNRRAAKAYDKPPPDEELKEGLREAAQRIDFHGRTRVRQSVEKR